MTLEERVAQLEAQVAELQVLLLSPPPAYSLEDQRRMKLAARALGKKEGR